MCDKCLNSVSFMPFTAYKNIKGSPLYCACIYDEIPKKLIRAVKFHNKRNLAYYQTLVMFQYFSKIPQKPDKATVIPVPVYSLKKRRRKFDHVAVVAEEFCKLTGYNLNKTSLKRTKYTEPLYKFSASKRAKILENSFEFNPSGINFENPVIVLDDISTTGSTLKEIKKVLSEKGVNNVIFFTTACAQKKNNDDFELEIKQ